MDQTALKVADIDADAGGSNEFQLHWAVLLACALGIAIGVTGIVPYTTGVLMPPMLKTLGWTKSEFSFGITLQTWVAAACAPIAGYIADRIGVRIPVGIALVCFALTMLGLAALTPNLMFYLALMVVSGVLSSCCGPLFFTRALSRAFVRYRGLAIGICMSTVGAMAFVYPLVLTAINTAHGWRTSYVALAALVSAGMPIVVIFIGNGGRKSPVAGLAAADPAAPVQARLDWGELFRSRVFWRLLVAFILAGGSITGYMLHMVPLLREAGMAPGKAAMMQSFIGASICVSRLLTGAAADRIFAPWVAGFLMIAAAIGVACLALLGVPAALPAVILVGLAFGSEVNLLGYMTSRYFDLNIYGRVYGVLYCGSPVAAGSSPFWMGLVADHFGRYTPALWVSAVMLVGSAALLFTAPRFPKPLEAAE